MSSKERAHDSDKASSKQRPPKPATQDLSTLTGQPRAAAIIRRARLARGSLTARDVLQLQRAVGNRAVGRLLAPPAPRPPSPGKGNHAGLPDDLKAGVEDLSGLSVDDVRVHYNSAEPARVQALAFTDGMDIHVAPGQERHLPHEAWHVVQQKQGRVKPSLRLGGRTVNHDSVLEQEASVMGAKAASTPPAGGLRGSFAGVTADGPRRDSAKNSLNAPGPIQCKFGFELETKVILSKGPAQTTTEEEETAHPSGTFDELIEMGRAEIDQLPHEYHALITGTLFIYEWSKKSRASADEAKPPHVIRPAAVAEGEPGRWLKWTYGRKEKETAEGEFAYFDPLFGKKDKVFSATPERPFDVVEDHNPSLKDDVAADGRRHTYSSIVELVTEARDEGRADALEPIEAAYQAAQAMEQATEKFTRRVRASAVFPGARSDLYIGLDKFPDEKVFQSTAASMQATIAVQLAGIPHLMGAMTERKRPMKGDLPILQASLHAADKAMETLEKQSKGSITARTAPNLFGLLHLVCTYLIGGHLDFGWDTRQVKNMVPFLVRDEISKIRVAGLSDNEEELLTGGSFADELPGILMDVTGRKGGEKLFARVEGSPSVAEWLLGVLSGTSDKQAALWDEMRIIPPEEVGPGAEGERVKAPVLEERQVPSLDAKYVEPGYNIPAGQWLAIAADYQKRLLEYNAPVHMSEKIPEGEGQIAMSENKPQSLATAFGHLASEVQAPIPTGGSPVTETATNFTKGKRVRLKGGTKEGLIMEDAKGGKCLVKFEGTKSTTLPVDVNKLELI